MNKKQLSIALSERTGLSQVKSMEVLNALFDSRPGSEGIIPETLNNDERVVVPGFGTFGTKTRKSRTGTNPSDSNKKITIPERKFAFFKQGKLLAELIKN